jgi:hypothetical protein
VNVVLQNEDKRKRKSESDKESRIPCFGLLFSCHKANISTRPQAEGGGFGCGSKKMEERERERDQRKQETTVDEVNESSYNCNANKKAIGTTKSKDLVGRVERSARRTRDRQ